MSDNKYELRYLSLFYTDLEETVSYITAELNNITAARNLVSSVEKAILERLPNAESFEPYQSKKSRQYPYYRIYVGNYTVYYVVIHEEGKSVMEVRRLLYNGRDRDRLI